MSRLLLTTSGYSLVTLIFSERLQLKRQSYDGNKSNLDLNITFNKIPLITSDILSRWYCIAKHFHFLGKGLVNCSWFIVDLSSVTSPQFFKTSKSNTLNHNHNTKEKLIFLLPNWSCGIADSLGDHKDVSNDIVTPTLIFCLLGDNICPLEGADQLRG